MSKDKIIVFNNKEPKNDLIRRNRLITEKKKKTDLKKTSPILNELKKNKKFFEEYLSTSFDDMAFDDAIVKDDRNFREILCEILKEKQIIMNTFVAEHTYVPYSLPLQKDENNVISLLHKKNTVLRLCHC